jgi:TetR/AcrR family transcriptional regulator
MPQTKTSQRRPRNAARAQEAILSAAEMEFARHGFAGARVDAIAKAAGYNKSLIFQYFGDKLGLYTDVLKRVDAQATRVGLQILGSLSPDAPITRESFGALVREMVTAMFDYVVEHPQPLRIIAWEEAGGWTTLRKLYSQLDHSDVHLFMGILDRARQAGVLRPEISPHLFLMILTNVCRTYITSLPVFQMVLFGDEPASKLDTPDALAQARDEIAAFVVHGLIADS